MELHETATAGATVLTPVGRLDSATARELEATLNAVLERTLDSIVIDMSELTFVSSAGLRVFLLAAKRLNAQDRGFVLCALQPRVGQVFEISGFAKIIAIEPDRASALGRLGAG
jgi:anti-anti-sigma factor